ncbi:MAG: ABC-F family ATP-binding cassette domain-containing protein [Muribaculaceae bacterium]
MASILQINSLTKSVGDRVLFQDVTLGIFEGDKIGLIAKNGMGKTTLLRCLAGIESADSGDIVYRNDLRVGYLEQTPELDGEMSVLQAAFAHESAVTKAVSAYELAIISGNQEEMLAAMQEMDASSAWDYEDRLKQLLTQFRITNLTQKVGSLSGGQKKRLALARVILDEPEFLILDEPTNHLDIDSIEWLEAYLKRSRMTLLLVTHDRYFLDRVCNKIIEIDRTNVYSYEGNYDYYVRRRAERIEAMSAELARVKNTLRKEQDWMSRQPQARAGKARYRINAFYDLKDRSRIDLTEKNVALEVKSSYIGSKIFEAEHISKRFGDKIILDDFNYIFSRYEKLGIIGENGVGKSTFIKMLQGLVPQDSGTWNVGETVKFGYYSQEGISFDESKKVIDAITDIAEDITYNEGVHIAPMQFLQRFLFTPADQQKYIYKLSGGERARLHLASVLMRYPNFLILDEPTNDLDIVTLGILEDYLSEFKGCVIVISHDRFFLDSIVDHLFVFQGNGVIKDFPGTYSEYREWLSEQKSHQAVPAKESGKQERQRTERKAKMTYKEKKEFEEITSRLESLNGEKAALDALFNSGEQLEDVAAKAARYEAVKNEIDELEMRWLELSEREE